VKRGHVGVSPRFPVHWKGGENRAVTVRKFLHSPREGSRALDFTKTDTAGEFKNAREPRFTQGLHEPKRRDVRASIRLLVGYLPYHGEFASSSS
jgi:hypothetical protein